MAPQVGLEPTLKRINSAPHYHSATGNQDLDAQTRVELVLSGSEPDELPIILLSNNNKDCTHY